MNQSQDLNLLKAGIEVANEAELQARIDEYFRQFFHVQREVRTKDGTGRIDLIMVHKSDIWDRKYPIGIEVKLNKKKRGKDLAEWLKQSSSYSEKEFEGYGKILVVTYP